MSDDEKEEFKKAALANARCMREHGIDTSRTRCSTPTAARRSASSEGLNPESAKFQAAQKACEKTHARGRRARRRAGEDEK